MIGNNENFSLEFSFNQVHTFSMLYVPTPLTETFEKKFAGLLEKWLLWSEFRRKAVGERESVFPCLWCVSMEDILGSLAECLEIGRKLIDVFSDWLRKFLMSKYAFSLQMEEEDVWTNFSLVQFIFCGAYVSTTNNSFTQGPAILSSSFHFS